MSGNASSIDRVSNLIAVLGRDFLRPFRNLAVLGSTTGRDLGYGFPKHRDSDAPSIYRTDKIKKCFAFASLGGIQRPVASVAFGIQHGQVKDCLRLNFFPYQIGEQFFANTRGFCACHRPRPNSFTAFRSIGMNHPTFASYGACAHNAFFVRHGDGEERLEPSVVTVTTFRAPDTEMAFAIKKSSEPRKFYGIRHGLFSVRAGGEQSHGRHNQRTLFVARQKLDLRGQLHTRNITGV